ncbi:hypothetical protein H696_03118 [Fonticula alba]|uniref:Uncharacterized protein n=1 Tax=Fonticula alba TaxID=691883 RepID=A0A058ZA09_FONAL|nr:hypothetical protein H696_03118 [Fonticula alba]KCV70768.1 hypothetical protein H696_03118 [Fonticula alba]|eukprot:XP_009495284.1 hypothetical protein H696_03118 [Fonticula alba]
MRPSMPPSPSPPNAQPSPLPPSRTLSLSCCSLSVTESMLFSRHGFRCWLGASSALSAKPRALRPISSLTRPCPLTSTGLPASLRSQTHLPGVQLCLAVEQGKSKLPEGINRPASLGLLLRILGLKNQGLPSEQAVGRLIGRDKQTASRLMVQYLERHSISPPSKFRPVEELEEDIVWLAGLDPPPSKAMLSKLVNVTPSVMMTLLDKKMPNADLSFRPCLWRLDELCTGLVRPSNTDMARELSVSANSISLAMSKYGSGMKAPSARVSEHQIEQIKAAFSSEEPPSVRDLAMSLGLSKMTLYRECKKLNLPTRGRLPPRSLLETLGRLHFEQGISKKDVALQMELPQSTVNRYFRLYFTPDGQIIESVAEPPPTGKAQQ